MQFQFYDEKFTRFRFYSMEYSNVGPESYMKKHCRIRLDRGKPTICVCYTMEDAVLRCCQSRTACILVRGHVLDVSIVSIFFKFDNVRL